MGTKAKSTRRAYPIVVIIAPINYVRIPRGVNVQWFFSLTDYDTWRRSRNRKKVGRIATAVDTLLKDVAGSAHTPEMRMLLTWLKDCSTVPTVRDLSDRWTSRRSFFRAWQSSFTCSPATFLSRVRAEHARRLLRRGMTVKEVATAAGMHSANEMYRLLRRWH